MSIGAIFRPHPVPLPRGEGMRVQGGPHPNPRTLPDASALVASSDPRSARLTSRGVGVTGQGGTVKRSLAVVIERDYE